MFDAPSAADPALEEKILRLCATLIRCVEALPVDDAGKSFAYARLAAAMIRECNFAFANAFQELVSFCGRINSTASPPEPQQKP